jgi:membrane protein required for colicin V production
VLAAITTPDAIVIATIAFFALRGAVKGFVWQLVRTVGLLLGLVLATQYATPVGRFLAERFSAIPAAASDLVGWLLIVLGTLLMLTLLAHTLRNAVRQADLTALDRFLGAALGAVFGLGLAAIVFTLYASSKTETERREMLQGSASTEYMAKFIDTVTPLFPESVRGRWGGVLHTLEK